MVGSSSLSSVSKFGLLVLLLELCLFQSGHADPTLLQNVQGYTLAGDGLRRFSGLVFKDGKVIKTGATEMLRKEFPRAQVIDGQGRTPLPGLIDAHGHVMDPGLSMCASSSPMSSASGRHSGAYATMPRPIPMATGCWEVVGMKSRGK